MPSEPKDPSDPWGEFKNLLDAVQAILNNVPDRYHQCAAALKDVMMNEGARGRQLLLDMKAHPANKAADEQQLTKLAITMGNALANYAKCLHTLPLRLA